MIFALLLTFVLLIFWIYLIAIYPNLTRKLEMKPYENVYIAHRGLFNNKDIPENSIKAFKKAVKNGYGIELDVQLTIDNKLVVFHDESLLRMTGINKILNRCNYDEIKDLTLLNTKQHIPLFEDVLKVLDKKTPLIIEIKPEGRYIDTTKAAVEMMKNYDGIYNMESFNPSVVRYLRENEPQIIRGQLSHNYFKQDSNINPILKFVLTYLLLNFYTKPDYIAYDCLNTSNLSFKIVSNIYKGECVAWTIKSQEQLEENRNKYKCFIFDSFIPKEKDD